MSKIILKSNSAFVAIGDSLPSYSTRQRTNMVLYSEEFNRWDKSGTNPPTIILTDTNGPFNIQTAEKITFGTSENSRVQRPVSAPIGTYTFSVWLRADSPVKMRIGTTTGGTVINVTTQWQRFYNTRTITSPGTLYPQIQKMSGDSSEFSFYVYGAQVESGSVPTNYIKTTTSSVTITENIENAKLFSLTQNCNFGVSYDYQKLKHIGSQQYIVNDIFQAPTVNLTLDYLHTPYLNNELLLGFNGNSYIYQNAISNLMSRNNNFYLACDTRDFKNGLDEPRTLYPDNIDFSGFSIFSFGDCYLSNYSLDFNIGQIPRVSASFTCSNMKTDALIDSEKFELIEGSFSWSGAKNDAESRGGRLAILDTEIKQSKVENILTKTAWWIGGTDTGQEGVFKWINGNLLSSGYQNWTLDEPNNAYGIEHYMNIYGPDVGVSAYKWNDLPNDSIYNPNGYVIEYGVAETKNIITTPSVKYQGILNLADTYYSLASGFVSGNTEALTEYNPPVSLVSTSKFILDDLKIGGVALDAPNNPILQSLAINLNFDRNDLFGLGSDHAYDRKLNFPVNASIDISLLVSGINDGFISGDLYNKGLYAFTIHAINQKNYITGSYKFNNCTLNSFSYSMQLNDIMKFNASFNCAITETDGFLMKRSIDSNGLFYQDIDNIWRNLSITWDGV